jgi:serine protease Do
LKNNEQIKSLLRPVLASAAAATVRVSCDGHPVALGTVVDADGLILTKASQLGEKPECRLADGRTLPAKLLGTDEATDLALLHVDAKNLTPVVWTDPPTPGSMVAATAPGSGPLAIGAISDVPQPMPGPTRDGRPHGWLGVRVGPADEGAEVEEITPGSAADKAGLRNGDLIKRLDGTVLRSSDELIDKLRGMPPNKAVSLTVVRKDKDMEVKVTLSSASGRLEQDHWGGGPFSDRRWGFSKVIPHDLGISPTDCGGPLVDLDGRCVGVNIARALRVASYALPASVVKDTVEKLRKDAK